MQFALHAKLRNSQIAFRVWLAAHPANSDNAFAGPPCQSFSNARGDTNKFGKKIHRWLWFGVRALPVGVALSKNLRFFCRVLTGPGRG